MAEKEYIEREAVLEMLKRECSPKVFAYLADQVNAIPAADVRPVKWIPVTERLPEFGQKVLAWVKNKDQEGRFNRDGIYTAELKDKMPKPDSEGKRNFWGIPGYDSVWTVWSWSYFTEPDVLFWMPLPQPPKEE